MLRTFQMTLVSFQMGKLFTILGQTGLFFTSLFVLIEIHVSKTAKSVQFASASLKRPLG